MKGGVDEYHYIYSIKGDEFANMFKALANHYLRRFCQRNDLDYKVARWEGDEPGSRAYFENELTLTFDELRFVVENQIGLPIVMKWYKYAKRVEEIEEGIRKSEKFTTLPKIHLDEWCRGEPLPIPRKRLKKLKEMANRHIAKYERLRDKHKGGV